jgi:hypothetical protein
MGQHATPTKFHRAQTHLQSQGLHWVLSSMVRLVSMIVPMPVTWRLPLMMAHTSTPVIFLMFSTNIMLRRLSSLLGLIMVSGCASHVTWNHTNSTPLAKGAIDDTTLAWPALIKYVIPHAHAPSPWPKLPTSPIPRPL